MLPTKGFIPQVQLPQILLTPYNSLTWHLVSPIVSSGVVVMYGVTKELANILRPLAGHSLSISETSNTL